MHTQIYVCTYLFRSNLKLEHLQEANEPLRPQVFWLIPCIWCALRRVYHSKHLIQQGDQLQC